MKHALLFSLPMVVVVLLAMTACNKKPGRDAVDGDDSSQPTVKVARITAGNLKLEVKLAASVRGYETADLKSRIDGFVEQVNVDIGDTFEKNDVLAVIRAPELANEVGRRREMLTQAKEGANKADADVKLASARHKEQRAYLSYRMIQRDRAQRLFDQGALNQEKLDEAVAQVQAINAAILSAKANIIAARANHKSMIIQIKVAEEELAKAISVGSFRVIRAPFAGTVTRRDVDPGALVSQSGTSLLSVAVNEKVKVTVHLPIDLVSRLDRNDPVILSNMATDPSIVLKKVGDEPLVISRFSTAINRDSRLLLAEIDVVENGSLARPLTIGDYGEAAIVLQDYKDKPTVLASAVGTNRLGKYVLVVDNNVCTEVAVRALLTKTVKEGEKEVAYTVIESVDEKNKDKIDIGVSVVDGDLESVPRGKPLNIGTAK